MTPIRTWLLRHKPVVFDAPVGRIHDRGTEWRDRYSVVRADRPEAPLEYRTYELALAAVSRLTLAEAYTVHHAQSRDYRLWRGDRFDIDGALLPAEMTVMWKCVNNLPYTPAEEAYAKLPEVYRLLEEIKLGRERTACFLRFHRQEDSR